MDCLAAFLAENAFLITLYLQRAPPLLSNHPSAIFLYSVYSNTGYIYEYYSFVLCSKEDRARKNSAIAIKCKQR